MLHGHPKSHVVRTFFSKFFCQRGLASFVTPRVTDVAWSSQITCCQTFFFKIFLSKGSCKLCYSRSNRLCMVIQSHMFFKLFFKIFCQRGLASFVTPRVTDCAWSSQITCFSFFKFFFVKGVLQALLLRG